MQQYETAEGIEEGGPADAAQMEAALEIFVERRMFEVIPNLVDQVRFSEELYRTGQGIDNAEVASRCADAARKLLDLRYGPIQGLETTPPVVSGRWNWR